MTRRRDVVVFGPYPPMAGPVAAATLERVRAALAGGADVRVISPVPSGAHHHADLSRPAGAWRFARQAVGARRLVVRLDAGVLTGTAHRGQLPARLALAAALRSAGESTLYLPAGVTPPARWFRLVLSAAGEVVVDPPAADRPPAGGGSARAPAATLPAGEEVPSWDLGAEPTREEIEAEIRRRAATHRAARRPVAESGAAMAARRAAIRTLRTMPLLGPAPPSSARPFAGAAKRVVQRLVAWQVNPIINHLNVLHQAFVEAIEPRADRGPVPGPAVRNTPDDSR